MGLERLYKSASGNLAQMYISQAHMKPLYYISNSQSVKDLENIILHLPPLIVLFQTSFTNTFSKEARAKRQGRKTHNASLPYHFSFQKLTPFCHYPQTNLSLYRFDSFLEAFKDSHHTLVPFPLLPTHTSNNQLASIELPFANTIYKGKLY